MKKRIRLCRWISFLMLTLLLAGCGGKETQQERTRLDYTVTSEDRLPEELKILVDGKKQQPFKMTYQDGEYIYICQGYGVQPTGGYSIKVQDVYRTSNAIYFSVTLIGPSQKEQKIEKPTTPYIVVKTDYQDMTVIFD